MPRRRALVAAAAGTLAMLAGAGVALHRRGAAAGDGEALWSQRFQRLDRTDALEARSLRGRPLLLNFWAPWCVPCVAELPLLAEFLRTQPAGGWQVLALAVDAESPVREFIREHRLALPVAMAGDGGLELARRLGNDVGGLPFSAVFDADGRLAFTKLGSLDEALLARWAGARR